MDKSCTGTECINPRRVSPENGWRVFKQTDQTRTFHFFFSPSSFPESFGGVSCFIRESKRSLILLAFISHHVTADGRVCDCLFTSSYIHDMHTTTNISPRVLTIRTTLTRCILYSHHFFVPVSGPRIYPETRTVIVRTRIQQ